MTQQIHLGTSGWQYGDWKGVFYPDGLPTKDWLHYYATLFNTVEINSTFYRMPRSTTTENWYKQVPEHFLFTLKINRFFTHTKRLAVDDEFRHRLNTFINSAQALGKKLGMVLVQLPPSLRADYALLKNFFEVVNGRLPLALECRHASWFTPETKRILKDYKVLWVVNDSPNRWPAEKYSTKQGAYLRFHGNKVLYKSSYSDAELSLWANEIHRSPAQHIWIYFNNDFGGVGAENARTMQSYFDQELRRAG